MFTKYHIKDQLGEPSIQNSHPNNTPAPMGDGVVYLNPRVRLCTYLSNCPPMVGAMPKNGYIGNFNIFYQNWVPCIRNIHTLPLSMVNHLLILTVKTLLWGQVVIVVFGLPTSRADLEGAHPPPPPPIFFLSNKIFKIIIKIVIKNCIWSIS